MRLGQIRIHRDMFLRVVAIGVPCGISGILQSASNVILQSSVNSFNSADIIAGNTAATDLNQFSYLVNSAFASACVSFAGQCYGAQKYDRLTKAMRSAMLIGSGLTLFIGSFIIVFPRFFLGFFASDPAVIDAGISKTIIMMLTIVPYTLGQILMGVLRGMRKSTGPTVINAFAVCLPRILWILFIFPLNPTTFMLYLCLPVSNLLDFAALLIYYLREQKRLQQRQLEGSQI